MRCRGKLGKCDGRGAFLATVDRSRNFRINSCPRTRSPFVPNKFPIAEDAEEMLQKILQFFCFRLLYYNNIQPRPKLSVLAVKECILISRIHIFFTLFTHSFIIIFSLNEEKRKKHMYSDILLEMSLKPNPNRTHCDWIFHCSLSPASRGYNLVNSRRSTRRGAISPLAERLSGPFFP